MAVTTVTTAMAGAINYTRVVDSSSDWASVPNSTYFYDKSNKENFARGVITLLR